MAWEQSLGGGSDGYSWKVRIGHEHFVVKVVRAATTVSRAARAWLTSGRQFYDTSPPDWYCYWAIQRECQNAAVLQMIEAALAQSGPIQVCSDPRTHSDALDNLYSFSDESIAASIAPEPPCTSLVGMPRMRKCFGWLKVHGRMLSRLPSALRPQAYDVDRIRRGFGYEEYFAIVYEFIDEEPNDAAVVEDVARFLWLTGFGHTMSPAGRNWKAGVLIDLSDVVYACGLGWNHRLYEPDTAEYILA